MPACSHTHPAIDIMEKKMRFMSQALFYCFLSSFGTGMPIVGTFSSKQGSAWASWPVSCYTAQYKLWCIMWYSFFIVKIKVFNSLCYGNSSVAPHGQPFPFTCTINHSVYWLSCVCFLLKIHNFKNLINCCKITQPYERCLYYSIIFFSIYFTSKEF